MHPAFVLSIRTSVDRDGTPEFTARLFFTESLLSSIDAVAQETKSAKAATSTLPFRTVLTKLMNEHRLLLGDEHHFKGIRPSRASVIDLALIPVVQPRPTR